MKCPIGMEPGGWDGWEPGGNLKDGIFCKMDINRGCGEGENLRPVRRVRFHLKKKRRLGKEVWFFRSGGFFQGVSVQPGLFRVEIRNGWSWSHG